ncbi:MAG: hypothetical protein IJ641_02085 [Lachnospiraceae bacterium]|nr:hypothetical protein [Lachnospiraceae bacterium]
MSNAVKEIADNADMIVDGYAFTCIESGYRVMNIDYPDSTMIIDSKDRVIETTMDDIEIDVVMELYNRNKEFLEV